MSKLDYLYFSPNNSSESDFIYILQYIKKVWGLISFVFINEPCDFIVWVIDWFDISEPLT